MKNGIEVEGKGADDVEVPETVESNKKDIHEKVESIEKTFDDADEILHTPDRKQSQADAAIIIDKVLRKLENAKKKDGEVKMEQQVSCQSLSTDLIEDEQTAPNKRKRELFEQLKVSIEKLITAKEQNRSLSMAINSSSMLNKLRQSSSRYSLKDTHEKRQISEQYYRRLTAFKDMCAVVDDEMEQLREDIKELEDEHEQYKKKYLQEETELLKIQREMGKNAIDSRGAPLTSMIVDKLIKKQKEILVKTDKTRSTFLKVKSQKQAIEEELKQYGADESGGVLLYESLMKDNTDYKERLEERDHELRKLRDEADNIINKDSHITAVIDETMIRYQKQEKKLLDITNKNSELKKRVIVGKRKKGYLQDNTKMLKNKGGMLFYPQLVRDYYETDEKILKAKKTLEELEAKFNKREAIINNLQEKIGSSKLRFYEAAQFQPLGEI